MRSEDREGKKLLENRKRCQLKLSWGKIRFGTCDPRGLRVQSPGRVSRQKVSGRWWVMESEDEQMILRLAETLIMHSTGEYSNEDRLTGKGFVADQSRF